MKDRGEEIRVRRDETPAAMAAPPARVTVRSGRGSLRGKLVAADDWDRAEVNEAIADDFGLMR